MSPRRIYLDNAATSWPKPEAVYQAVDSYLRQNGAAHGRSSYREATEVERGVERVRRAALELAGGAGSHQAVFTHNCTAALNLAIHGVLRPGDHAITTVIEHNSVLRPLKYQELHGEVTVDRVDCDDLGVVDPEDVRRAIRPHTRLIAIAHASNVTGALQPVEAIAALARERGIICLVDAAQTLGHVPIDLQRAPADLLAAPGHKGALGPLGTGILYLRQGLASELRPLLQGGTGTESESDLQPEGSPERFESGNPNVPGILGLGAGLEYLQQRGVDKLAAHAGSLTERLLTGLRETPGIRVHGPESGQQRVGVVSFNAEGYDPVTLALALEASHGIQVRAGLHCAGAMHRRLGTLEQGGAVRASFGPFNTEADVDTLLAALVELLAAAPGV